MLFIEDVLCNEFGFVLFFIDLDMFKEVNDMFGYIWGDELLCFVFKWLLDCLSE